MVINDKNVLLFPEYHLTDYPPKIPLTFDKALDFIDLYKRFDFNIIICGYIETKNKILYSSCLVQDEDSIYNIQKSNPDPSEDKIISPGIMTNKPINLSIGNSYFLLCRDFIIENKNDKLKNILDNENIENLFLISAMFYNFDKTIEIGKNFIKQNLIRKFIVSDRFNGNKLFE